MRTAGYLQVERLQTKLTYIVVEYFYPRSVMFTQFRMNNSWVDTANVLSSSHSPIMHFFTICGVVVSSKCSVEAEWNLRGIFWSYK